MVINYYSTVNGSLTTVTEKITQNAKRTKEKFSAMIDVYTVVFRKISVS